jgi:hypothetical protein
MRCNSFLSVLVDGGLMPSAIFHPFSSGRLRNAVIDVIRNVLRSDMWFQLYAITGNACIGASEARAILTESETDYRERRNFRGVRDIRRQGSLAGRA